jgi:hypothetical protein
MNEPITFIADKVKITGPKVDGGYSVTFMVGEYQQLEVAKMVVLPPLTALKVTVELYQDGRRS